MELESYERKVSPKFISELENHKIILIYFDADGNEYIDLTAAEELNIRVYDKIYFPDSVCGTITQIFKDTIKKLRLEGYGIEYRMISISQNINYSKEESIINMGKINPNEPYLNNDNYEKEKDRNINKL